MGYNSSIMIKKFSVIYLNYTFEFKINTIWKVISLLGVFLFAFPVHGQADTGAFTFGEKQSCDYYLYADMPQYCRALPIALDDPMRFSIEENALLPYEFGYVHRNINDYYSYDWITKVWKGTALRQDAGVLIGGNAASRTERKTLDTDPNDFSRILPYASIYIEPEKLGFSGGSLEYNFYSDDFALNCPKGKLPRNILIREGKDQVTAYQLRETGDDRIKDWTGIVYTGGIAKTIRNEDGAITETSVQMPDGSPLFTVRYRDAVRDRYGEHFDLELSFTRFTFAAEANVEGALAVMESSNIFLAPLLTENGSYAIDPDGEGIRIGARVEFDYRMENQNGEEPEGVYLLSINDLDNPSMAPFLQTDADWGCNELGQDFRWAEGFGVRRGAASFAVLPYYNHTIPNVYRTSVNSVNGDSSLVRISRMENTTADGTANGLYFSANITASSGYEARNDGNTADTGVSMLIYPEGTLIAGGSAGARGSVSIPFFVPGVGCKIEQSASKGGRIWAEDVSFRDSCRTVENTASMKVVGSGAGSVHSMEPEKGYQIYSVRIDEVPIRFDKLIWVPGEEGMELADFEAADEYGTLSEVIRYRFTRDRNGVVSVAFENIQDAHEISVTFYRGGLLGLFEVLAPSLKVAVVIIAAYVGLVLAAVISWRRRKQS